MKKLIPALCMLLVAAALMGTSTYAWFTMNTEVSATGMKVTAAVPSSLYIDTTPGMANKAFTQVATNTATAKFLPASTAIPSSAGALTWYSAAAAEFDNAAAATPDEGDKYTAVTPTMNQEGNAIDWNKNQYYREDVFYVTNVDAQFTNFGVKQITVANGDPADGGSNDDLFEAIKVLVVVTDTNGTTFAGAKAYTITGADRTNNVVTDANNTTSHTFLGAAGESSNAAKTPICNLTANTVYKVSVFVYLDGEDASCTSQKRNELNLQSITLGIIFGECKPVAPAG